MPLTLFHALLPVYAMALFTAVGLTFFTLSSDMIVAVLLLSATVAGVVARRAGYGWEDIQRATGEKLSSVLPALLILLAIGALTGSWVLSGTIPWLVYWGVQLIRPEYLALTAFLATATMSIFTGTSWGSAGTIGVALMGTAVALGAPLPLTAGAVVSGAYLGDKMSPLSDSTNICAIGAGAPLFTHIRHMMYTAVPSLVLCLVLYSVLAGLGADSVAQATGTAGQEVLFDLERAFSLTPLALIPVVVVVGGIVARIPPVLAIMLSTVAALVVGVFVQGFDSHHAVLAAISGFRLEMFASAGGVPDGASDQFLRLIQRGGMYSMSSTLVVVIAAFLLAGAMHVSGALELIIRRLLATVQSVTGLLVATMVAGATMIGLTSHGGVTALVIGGLFQDAYRSRGLAPENLSRSLEDSVTIVEPLMPWTVSAVFMATTLGVSTLEYAPFAIFCYGGPVFSLLIAAAARRSSFGVARIKGEKLE